MPTKSLPTMAPGTGDEAAYDAVALPDLWGVFSLAFFLGAMTTRYLVRLLPPELQGWDRLPPNAVVAVPLLAAVGLTAALWGGRRRSLLCRAGFYLNLSLLLLSAALVALVVVWRMSR